MITTDKINTTPNKGMTNPINAIAAPHHTQHNNHTRYLSSYIHPLNLQLLHDSHYHLKPLQHSQSIELLLICIARNHVGMNVVSFSRKERTLESIAISVTNLLRFNLIMLALRSILALLSFLLTFDLFQSYSSPLSPCIIRLSCKHDHLHLTHNTIAPHLNLFTVLSSSQS